MLLARKISRVTLFHERFAASTIRFPSLGHGCSLPPPSLSLCLSFSLPIVASSPVSLARDTQMRPSILRSHCYSKCSLPIVTMVGHSWHCCRYCYYYRYCYRLRPTGEWRRGEPAASSSAALEANYTPSGLPPLSLSLSLSLSHSLTHSLTHFFTLPLRVGCLTFSHLRSGFYLLFKLEISIGIGFERCPSNERYRSFLEDFQNNGIVSWLFNIDF